MKLDQLAFGLFRRAYHAVLASPGDAKAQRRFDRWSALVSRIVGMPITGCHETHGLGRERWVRATATTLLAVMTAQYAAGVWLNPSKPEKPAPPRAAIAQITATSTVATYYVWDNVTGREFLGMPPLPRKPSTEQS